MMNNFSYTFSPFIDPCGRPSDKPYSQENGITDNGNLFMGEGLLLLSLLGRMQKSDIDFVDQQLLAVEVAPGLFIRHSIEFQKQYNISWHSTSHDEYNGICFMVAASPEFFRINAVDIVEYGTAYDWQYCDLYPRANFFPFFLDSPIKVAKELYAYIKDFRAHPEDSNSVDLRHPKHIVALTQIRQPRDRAFYKIAAALKPTLFETIYLAIAIIFSSTGDPSKGRGGTKLMVWFRMLAIQRLGSTSMLLKLAHIIFNRNLTKKLGSDYPLKLINSYFDRSFDGIRHPMIALVAEYLELRKK